MNLRNNISSHFFSMVVMELILCDLFMLFSLFSDNPKLNVTVLRRPFFFLVSPYNSESQILTFKIKYLYPLIDKFVLMVANMTFLGVFQKSFSFSPYADFLIPYVENETIRIFEVDLSNRSMCKVFTRSMYDIEENKLPFLRQCIMRNYAYLALLHSGIKINDYFFFGDTDEFPSRMCVEFLKINPPKSYLHIANRYYFQYTFRWTVQYNYAKFVFIRFNNNLSSINEYRYMSKPNRSNYPQVFMFHMSSNFFHLTEFIHKYKYSYAHQQTFKRFSNLSFCDLYLAIISKLLSPQFIYHQNLSFFPHYILNDPSLFSMFSSFPFVYDLDQFFSNCSHASNSTVFRAFQKKITSSKSNHQSFSNPKAFQPHYL